VISKQIKNDVQNASWIRAMFEEGERLRQIHGADKVFDFSLGNPDYEPPLAVREEMKRLLEVPGIHKYTSNAGYPDVRDKIAASLKKETGLPFTAEHIIMTCGAAGGLNVVLKTILNPPGGGYPAIPLFCRVRVLHSKSRGQTGSGGHRR
jgi:Aspartate/tyrosine/aromatic aminotransferase